MVKEILYALYVAGLMLGVLQGRYFKVTVAMAINLIVHPVLLSAIDRDRVA